MRASGRVPGTLSPAAPGLQQQCCSRPGDSFTPSVWLWTETWISVHLLFYFFRSGHTGFFFVRRQQDKHGRGLKCQCQLAGQKPQPQRRSERNRWLVDKSIKKATLRKVWRASDNQKRSTLARLAAPPLILMGHDFSRRWQNSWLINHQSFHLIDHNLQENKNCSSVFFSAWAGGRCSPARTSDPG